MQNTEKSEKVKELPNAVKWLAEGLQEYAAQLIRGDIGEIAKRIGKTEPAVRPYFKGEIADFNTGSVILTETRKLIIAREKEVKKLVA